MPCIAPVIARHVLHCNCSIRKWIIIWLVKYNTTIIQMWPNKWYINSNERIARQYIMKSFYLTNTKICFNLSFICFLKVSFLGPRLKKIFHWYPHWEITLRSRFKYLYTWFIRILDNRKNRCIISKQFSNQSEPIRKIINIY